MLLGVDHIVILVDSLDQAMQAYTAWGFTVGYGGEHTGGATHNALVAFQDNSYLELIAFKRSEPDHRWSGKTPGIVDYALLPSAPAEDIAAARARGVTYQGPLPGGRLRPDGQQVDWQLGLPPTPDLPFMCGDVTPRGRRVPQGDAQLHANGALGVDEVRIVVSDLATSADRYRALLGVEPLGESPDQRIVFPLNQARLVLVPQPEGEMGEGPRQVTLRTSRRPDGQGGYADTPGTILLSGGLAAWV